MKRSSIIWTSEEHFAAAVVAHLEADQWEVYQEVGNGGGSNRADIVAQRGSLIMVVECKLTASLVLLDQALEWQDNAHLVTVAYPTKSRSRSFDRACRDWGIGQIGVDSDGGVYYPRRGRLNRYPRDIHRLRRLLVPERKTFAKAGNARGQSFTPYAETCRCVLEVVKQSPGISMKELMEKIKGHHHYANDQSARSSLLKWGLKGSIRGVKVVREGKRIQFYPSESAQLQPA